MNFPYFAISDNQVYIKKKVFLMLLQSSQMAQVG